MKKNTNNYPVRGSSISNVLEIVRSEGRVSRIQIAQKLGLTPASISKLTKKLIEKKFIEEERIEKRVNGAGRPQILLKLNSQAGYIIGVYMAPKKIDIILTDLSLKMLVKDSQPIKNMDKKKIMDQLFSMIETTILGVDREKIFGIGVAMNGMVDSENGISIFSPHYDWDNFHIGKEIELKYGFKVLVDNDVRAMALGEMKFGVAEGQNDFVLINIENGIGAGIVIDGKLHRGVNFSAGEIGHLTIDTSMDERCSCGSKGCLEILASNWAIVDRTRARLKEGKKSRYLSGKIENLEIEDICHAVKKGDVLSRTILEETAGYISLGMRHLINLLNPGMIVIVGKLNLCGELFYKELLRLIREDALIDPIKDIRIKPSLLENDAATIGAVTLVLENLFKGTHIVNI
ncbi:ROK family transcriptional regulator [uncultured Ilyobacter sp.]|uniref:ROK family transcriptional regulator n=1 Tax=uncultured Ilyobacter sp. TaxID=544433 RepID=UPI0029C6A5AA|nr:ROK family transcriptional regulator [uncultured Ilyobacter sp.]